MTNAVGAPPPNDHPLGPVVRSQLKHGRIFARIRDDTVGIVIASIYCNFLPHAVTSSPQSTVYTPVEA